MLWHWIALGSFDFSLWSGANENRQSIASHWGAQIETLNVLRNQIRKRNTRKSVLWRRQKQPDFQCRRRFQRVIGIWWIWLKRPVDVHKENRLEGSPREIYNYQIIYPWIRWTFLASSRFPKDAGEWLKLLSVSVRHRYQELNISLFTVFQAACD